MMQSLAAGSSCAFKITAFTNGFYKNRKCTKRWGGRNHFTTTCTTQTRKVYNLRYESFNDSDMKYIKSIVVQPEMTHAVTEDYPKVS